MKHIDKEQWILYIRDHLPEAIRSEYDEHLYTCDQCMEVYLHAIEASDELSDVKNETAFTDTVMSQIQSISLEHVDTTPDIEFTAHYQPLEKIDVNSQRKVNSSTIETTPSQHQKKQRPFYQQTIFHYVLAAAMTIVLVTSGVFQSIANYVDDVQHTTISDQAPSITEQLLQRAFSEKNSKEAK